MEIRDDIMLLNFGTARYTSIIRGVMDTFILLFKNSGSGNKENQR